jgi:hypothetical protein
VIGSARGDRPWSSERGRGAAFCRTLCIVAYAKIAVVQGWSGRIPYRAPLNHHASSVVESSGVQGRSVMAEEFPRGLYTLVSLAMIAALVWDFVWVARTALHAMH